MMNEEPIVIWAGRFTEFDETSYACNVRRLTESPAAMVKFLDPMENPLGLEEAEVGCLIARMLSSRAHSPADQGIGRFCSGDIQFEF